jgi:hypothetical protein
MPTSQTTLLSKPSGDKTVPFHTYSYFRARAKRGAYEVAIREFQKSKLTKATLARRLGKGADRVSKMLAGPGNWTIDTLADLLFAISGGVPTFGVSYPLERPPRNYRQPDWLQCNAPNTTNTTFIVNFNPPDQPERPITFTKPRAT